ncbi:MAG: hypothetical protein HKP20_10910 [Akkermansiaceae bacterium]|nr:hypothetical protein [Akkermansiaceae bacterium]
MKTTLTTLLTSLALAVAAQAGDGKVVIPPPAPTCLWTWFAGGSAQTIQNDWEEEIYNIHLGIERTCTDSRCSHAFFLEVGYSDKDSGYHREEGAADVAQSLGLGMGRQIRVGVETMIMPITLNYKFECALVGNLNWYVGAGAGVALVDVEYYTDIDSATYDDAVFYAQAFAGLSYNITEAIEVYLGLRYAWMDDPSLTALGMFDDGITLGDKVSYELGARYNF